MTALLALQVTPDDFMAGRLVDTLALETIEMLPWLAGLLLVAYLHARWVRRKRRKAAE